MKKLVSFVLTMVLVLSPLSLLSTTVKAEDSFDWDRFRGKNVSINVYNWGEYISDGSDESINVNKAFEEKTGIKVNYTNFATNEEMYAKLKGGGASYDIVIPSDYMIGKMISEDMLEKLNFNNIPNFEFISDDFKNLEYDPKNEYSVPYTWGTVGIIYNTTMVEKEDAESWEILWDQRYMNNMLMFSNSRDAFAISLKRLGYSFNTTDEEELKHAAEELKKQKPLVQAYVMDEIFDKMGGGEAAIAPYYAGDAITMIADNPDLAFAVPKEGTNRFVDAICIPKGSKNKEAAELYINFLCETDIAVANCEYIGYSTPHSQAYEELDDEIKNDPIAYPSQEVLDKSEGFIELPYETNELIKNLWTEVISTNADQNKWAIPVLLIFCIAASVGINVYRKMRRKKEEQSYL